MSHVGHLVPMRARSLDLSTMNSERQAVISIAIIFTLIGLASMGLRLLTSVIRHRKSGYDDWVMLGAWLTSIGFLTAMLIGLRWGIGLDMTDAPAEWVESALKSLYATEVFYFTTMFLVKMSLVFLYHRLACDLHNTFYYGNFIIMTCLILQYLSTVITVGVQCLPIEKYWNPSLPGRCINVTAFFYANNVFTIVTDIVMIGLPVYLIWQVNRPRNQKIGVCAAFLIGGISTVASCVRLYSIRIFTQSTDPVQDAVPISICSLIEINLGILCASVPAMWPLFFQRPGMVPPQPRCPSFSEESKRKYLEQPYDEVDEYIRQSYFGDRSSSTTRPQGVRTKWSYTRDRQSFRPGSEIAGLPDIINFGHDPDGAYSARAQRADDGGMITDVGSRHIMIQTTFTMEDDDGGTPERTSSDDNEDLKKESWAYA